MSQQRTTRKSEDLPDVPQSLQSLPAAGQVLGAGVRTNAATQRYLVGALRGFPAGEQEIERFVASATRDSGARVVREIGRHSTTAAPAPALSHGHRVVVLQASADVAERLARSIADSSVWRGIVLEEDAPLTSGGAVRTAVLPNVLGAAVLSSTLRVTVVGRNEEPLVGAVVTALTALGPSRAVTDADGSADLLLFDDRTPPALEALYVRPRADYWSYGIQRPTIESAQPVTIRLASLDQVFPQFPSQLLVGWGLKAMRLDLLPPTQFDGRGVRVALIASGCATNHRNLRHVVDGLDLSNPDPSGWKSDELGLGTHCAGIIVGSGVGSGIRGIAPRAQLVAMKSAGPRVSDVIDALARSIDSDVDVICIPLGTTQQSVLLDQQLAMARQRGIACVAAAGDTGGAVHWPARSPHTLAVSAIGWRAAFPSDSHHTYAVREGGPSADGYFAAEFSSSGPEVDVCGPGVAVISSVPPDNFAAWDGTALAAAHVSGLAALVLAHHPDFAPDAAYERRTSARVDRLFEILRTSATPFQVDDSDHTGYGLPDAVRALEASGIAGVSDDLEDGSQLRSLQSLVQAIQRMRTVDQPTAALDEALVRAGLVSPV